MRIATVYVELDRQTHERLLNWGACLRPERFVPRRCESIEGLYSRTADPDIAKPSGDVASKRRPSTVRDMADAMVVDRVVRANDVPKLERFLLRAHYLDRDRSEKTCRALHIRWRDYDEHLRRAVLMVRNQLQRASTIDRARAPAYNARDTAEPTHASPACATTAPDRVIPLVS
jgi:hypothetical protein